MLRETDSELLPESSAPASPLPGQRAHPELSKFGQSPAQLGIEHSELHLPEPQFAGGRQVMVFLSAPLPLREYRIPKSLLESLGEPEESHGGELWCFGYI